MVFMLLGLALAVRDALNGVSPLVLSTVGEFWYTFSPGSLNLAQAVVQRHLSPWLWDPVILTVLLWPAALFFGLTGLVLLLLGLWPHRQP